MSTGSMRIVAGCLMITAGVFGPFYTAPLKGEVALFDASRGAGFVFLALAGLALFTGVTDKAWRAWLCGFAGLALSAVCLFNFYNKVGSIQSRFDRFFLGSVGQYFIDKIVLGWGFWALTGGSLLIVLGATAMIRARNVVNTYGSYSGSR